MKELGTSKVSSRSASDQHTHGNNHSRSESRSSHQSDTGEHDDGSEDARRDHSTGETRAKQQRLLLLWHASRCHHSKGHCPVTRHCATTKRIWAHIAQCSNPQCTEEYCLSSRYILHHYKNCKDSRCVVCGPVRRAIRESHEHRRKL